MYIHQSGTSYTVYLQNNKYAQQTLENREEITSSSGNRAQSGELDKGLDDYLNKIVNAIPELKASQEAGIGVGFVILPEGSSDNLKQSVSLATDRMIKNGADTNILKGILGVVREAFSYDIENNNGYSTIKNDTSSTNINDINSVMDKIKDTYETDKQLCESLSKFSGYLNEIWNHLNDQTGDVNKSSIFALSQDEIKGVYLNTSV